MASNGGTTPYPKPVKRIRDPEAIARKMELDPVCRMCGKRASDGHHALLRSQSGDDVEENVVPLCHGCHMRYHAGEGTIKLKRDELQYLIGKLGYQPGLEYMRRRRLSK